MKQQNFAKGDKVARHSNGSCGDAVHKPEALDEKSD